jgi:hypothetical protein
LLGIHQLTKKEAGMARKTLALLVGLALLALGPAHGADEPSKDNWKFTLYLQGQPQVLWLIKLTNKDGKWTGQVAKSREGVPTTTLSDLAVSDGTLRFNLKIEKGPSFAFEGKMPADAKKITGNVKQGSGVVPAEIEQTAMTSLDSFEVAKDQLAKSTNGVEVVDTAATLLRQASKSKAKPEEVRGWADKAFKAAEAYGTRYQREVTVRIAETLAKQDDYSAAALEYARKAERFLEPKDKPAVQRRTLEVLAEALTKAKKTDEAKDVQARLAKIDIAVKAQPFAGRKAKSDRVVLVELFTGAQCPPCVAADLAFDGLRKTFKPSEVVLLQYHLHVPGPDPLTNSDAEARAEFYGEDVGGTPALLFNGRVDAPGGGGMDDAEDKYKEYLGIIEPGLEKPTKANLKVSATQKGAKIDISADVSDLQQTGDRIKLRLALVEDTIAYKGSNGIASHHSVVRAFPGGVKGIALKEKAGKQTASVDLEELRKGLAKYLDNYTEKEGPFPTKDRPLDLKNLRVVAFVQNDQTKEVLQATQADVKTE